MFQITINLLKSQWVSLFSFMFLFICFTQILNISFFCINLDLKQIALRVDEKMYTTFGNFIGDLGKITDNCRLFNPIESHIHKAGIVWEKFCSQKMKTLRDFLERK
jgi:hypothetical protein